MTREDDPRTSRALNTFQERRRTLLKVLSTSAIVGGSAAVASASHGKLESPFTEEFESGTNGWTIDLHPNAADRVSKGEGSWSSKYNGSIRLYVNGGPDHIGVYHKVEALPQGTEIKVNYESPNLRGEPGGPRINVHTPSGDSFTIDNDPGGGGNNEPETDGVLKGTVPEDVPAGTEVEARLGTWPGEITVFVKDISVGGCDNLDAELMNFQVRPGTYSVGDEVPADVTFKNTGECDHEFFVGFTVFDKNETSYDNDGSNGHPVSVAAGEKTTTTVKWTVEDDVPPGPYDATTAIWKESDRDNLQTKLSNPDSIPENVFRVDNSNSVDYMRGKLTDVNGSPVSGFIVKLSSDNGLIAKAKTQKNGKFRFDSSDGDSRNIRESDLQSLREDYESVQILAHDSIPEEDAITQLSNWFMLDQRPSNQVFEDIKLGNEVLTKERIFGPPGFADEIPTDPAIWREVDPENTRNQILLIEVTSGSICQNITRAQAMEEGSLTLEVPENISVKYDQVGTFRKSINTLGDTVAPCLNTGNSRGLPLFELNKSTYEPTNVELSGGKQTILNSVAGEITGTYGAIYGLLTGIREILSGNDSAERLGGGIDATQLNEEDLISRGWSPTFGVDVASFVLKVPVEFNRDSNKEFGARGNWTIPSSSGISHKTYVLEEGFERGPKISDIY